MRYVLLIVALFLYSSIFSQRFFFKSYSTQDGLAQSQVTSICQDSLGYLWVGTLGGVSRYNGNKFYNYSTDNGLYNNRVTTIKMINSKLFIGHQGGVSIIENNKVRKYSLGKNAFTLNVTDIVSFNGKIIISTNGEGLFEFDNNKLTHLPLLNGDYDYVRDLVEWEDELYIATRSGVVRTKDLLKVDFFLDKDMSVSSLAVHKNDLVICTFYDGLIFYNKGKNSITRTAFEDKGLLFNHVIVDTRDNIWISTSSGLIRYSNLKTTIFDNSVGLPINIISTAYEDANSNIWIGTQGKGLVKANLGDIAYYDKSTGLPSDIILCGIQSKNGFYYFGTIDNGVFKTSDFKNYTSLIPTASVWCSIADIDGYSWFGTKNGLYSIDNENKIKVFNFDENAPGYKITTFYKIDSKSMYIGGSHGIVKYKDGTFTQIGKNSHSIGTIRNIILHNRQLLVGTDNGLYQLDKDNSFELVSHINRTVFSIVKSESGRIFFGTEDGLYEIIDENKIVRTRFSYDVASNYINFLSENKTDLIVGTNNGVYVIDIKSDKQNVKRIGASNGLVDPETNLNSSFIDKNGKLWFGTASALIKLDLAHFSMTKGQVNLHLDNVLLDYEAFDYAKYKGKIIAGIPQNMKFPYNKNNLQFNLDAVALSNYEDLSFQFKVAGLNDSWMPASKTSHIILNQIPAGSYTLYARVLMEDGSVMDELTVSFVIKEAFYKAWWFYVLISLVVLLIVFAWVKVRIKREQEKNELEQAELRTKLVGLEQQSLNASMNRHFIFNSLNSIQYFINISDKLSANKYLSNFAKLIRKNLDSSSEHDSMVTLNEEIERIKLYLSLESMRFRDKFTFSINANNVDLESVNIPAMLIQPFVENSIIHGILPQTEKVGEITIDINESNDYLSVKITDNGIGIDKSIEQNHGKGDHKSKGMEITTKRIALIKRISGKEMKLIGPFQVVNEQGEIAGTEVEIKISTI